MATSKDFKDFVMDCLQSIALESSTLRTKHLHFSARKMFGEYCIYVHEQFSETKVLFLLCDNMTFLKQHEALKPILSLTPKAKPFKGAKDYYIIDIESRELLAEILDIIIPLLAPTRPKKRKQR